MLLQIQKLLSCPIAVFSAVASLSAFSLAAALTAEIVYGLEPCVLCVYQRIPFALAIFISVLGIGLYKIKQGRRKDFTAALMALNALLFLANSVIAFYHSGVELHWWKSAVEGCAVPAFGDRPQSILENILSAPAARCDVIPWADPLLDLSMANYNVLLCFGLFIVCLVSTILIRRRPSC